MGQVIGAEAVGKIAYFVIGPESSGTRLTTELLVKAGCSGEYGHVQNFDITPLHKLGDLGDQIVVRRSLPHAGKWHDIRLLIRALEEAGFYVVVISIDRRIEYMAESQLRAKHVEDQEEAYHNIIVARNLIRDLGRTVHVYYETLVKPGKAEELLENLGLPTDNIPDIYDGNEKYEHFDS